jgi:diguanylate cyclase (GGDEF)-like protein
MPQIPALSLFPDLLVALAAVAAAAAVILALVARRAAARTSEGWDAAERRFSKERERCEVLDRELRAERERSSPDRCVERVVIDALARSVREISACATKGEVAEALGRAVEAAAGPKQWMVFLSADAEGKEFVVAASGGEPGSRAWKRGARLSSQSGKVGLAIRRRAPLDARDFESEPPIVREQVGRTEPRDFAIDFVVPVLVGDRVVAAIAVGETEVGLAMTRTVAETLATVASVVLRGLAARDRAERVANQDTLTGVGNRNWFNAAAAEDLYRIRQSGSSAAVVTFGVQHFQHYLRRNGTQAGDKLVRGIAQVIRPLVAEGHLLARWGTDEFVVFLPDTDLPAAWAFAARVRRAVGQVDWAFAKDQPDGRITLCAGLAGFPLSGDSLEKLVAAASATLADARESGVDTTGSVVIEPGAAAAIAAAAEHARAASAAATDGDRA